MQPQSDDTGLVEDFIIPLPALTATNSPGIVFVSFTREDPDVYAIASFKCTLKYISKELDPSTGVPEEEGYPDEYEVEDVELSAGGDYIVPSYASFNSEWERLKSSPSATETFALSAMESLKGKMLINLNVGYSFKLDLFSSCMRFYHRGTQHGASGWVRDSFIDFSTYPPTIRSGNWRRWLSTRALSNDVLERPGRHTGAGCTSRQAGSMRPRPGSCWWLIDIFFALSLFFYFSVSFNTILWIHFCG